MKMLLSFLLISAVINCFAQEDSLELYEFNKMECGLYKNEIGEIGFKTTYLIDDLGNHGNRFQTYAYMVDGSDTSEMQIEELKNIVDTNSFQILNDYYCKDKNYVYAIFYTSSGATFNVTKTIDTKSFRVYSNSSYGIDSQYVYFRTYVVKNADRETFNAIDDTYWAYDKNHFYNYGEIASDKEAKERGYFKK
jgi:hypothetical protein